MASEQVTVRAIMLGLGGIFNILFIICLRHTWRYWKQVKWYITMLLIANWLEIFFRFGMMIGWYSSYTWEAPNWSCKILMMMRYLGPSLALMALAALSVHVLMTGITSCQGNRLRHVVIIGLFVLLSLPVPLSLIPTYSALLIPHRQDGKTQCVQFGYFKDEQQRFYYDLGFVLGLCYFPLLIFVCCGMCAVFLYLATRRGPPKPSDYSIELLLLSAIGMVTVMCEVPPTGYQLASILDKRSTWNNETYSALHYLEMTRNTLSAAVAAVFCFVLMHRKRGEARGQDLAN